MTMKFVDSWNSNTLNSNEIYHKIVEYSRDLGFMICEEEAWYITGTIMRACKAYHEGTKFNEFIVQLANDSIRAVFAVADQTNRKYLAVYDRFFYNCVPGDWREKLGRGGGWRRSYT